MMQINWLVRPGTSARFACKVLLLSGVVAATINAAVARADQDPVRPSVVKIHTTQRGPDLFRPWTKGAPREVSGTGFIIDGKRILTNAHVVSYPSQIYVQPYQSAEKFPAKVVAVASPIDLAVLSVEDEALFTDRPGLALDDSLPRVKASVNVYGYPIGGDQLSVTEGIASRVEYTAYYSGTMGLRIQIDAALNPGNSGGPAISDGKVIGVAFSGLSKAENIGYLIPIDEVRTFLDDIHDGKYDGKPKLWDEYQTTENDALRAWLKLPKDAGGSMITKRGSDEESYPLQERDVITRIGPHALDRSGNVRLGDDLQVMFTYYVPKLAHDGIAPLTVLRNGQSLEIAAPVPARHKRVIPQLDGAYPAYFILGPMVFSTASAELVTGIYSEARYLTILAARKSPLVTRANDPPAFEGEELVIIPAPFFSHRLTKGYDSPALRVVAKLNDVPIKNLVHLVELVRDSQDAYLEFKFAESEVERLVFRREEMLSATEDILTDNGIRKQYSDDLDAAWKKK